MITTRTREKNGRQRRLARDEDALVARIARQPHRRGERTTAGATPWQRAIRAGTIRDASGQFTPGELEMTGLRFVEAREDYLKAIGAPNGFAVDSGGSGGDITHALRKKWLGKWQEIQVALWSHGRRPYAALLAASEASPDTDERKWPTDFRIAASEALRCLSAHFGRRNK